MTAELPTQAQRARAELAATVSEIEAKLNLPKRVRRLRDERPFLFTGIGLGLAVATAGAVWGAVRLIRK
jgi:hypothetical protein